MTSLETLISTRSLPAGLFRDHGLEDLLRKVGVRAKQHGLVPAATRPVDLFHFPISYALIGFTFRVVVHVPLTLPPTQLLNATTVTDSRQQQPVHGPPPRELHHSRGLGLLCSHQEPSSSNASNSPVIDTCATQWPCTRPKCQSAFINLWPINSYLGLSPQGRS